MKPQKQIPQKQILRSVRLFSFFFIGAFSVVANAETQESERRFSEIALQEEGLSAGIPRPHHYVAEQIDRIFHSINTTAQRRQRAEALPSPCYFLVLFGTEGLNNPADQSHTFGAVIRVKNKRALPEWFPISWLPENFFTHKEKVCIFRNTWEAFSQAAQTPCAPEPGKLFSLYDTLTWTLKPDQTLGIWGPYRVTAEYFNLFLDRIRLLHSGNVAYLADDRSTRTSGKAINCMHAISDMPTIPLIPYGGKLNTGFGSWGFPGTQHVLYHLFNECAWIGEVIDTNKFRKIQSTPPLRRRHRRP